MIIKVQYTVHRGTVLVTTRSRFREIDISLKRRTFDHNDTISLQIIRQTESLDDTLSFLYNGSSWSFDRRVVTMQEIYDETVYVLNAKQYHSFFDTQEKKELATFLNKLHRSINVVKAF